MQLVGKFIFGLLKFLDGRTHSARQLRQLLRAKQNENDQEDDDQVRSAKFMKLAKRLIGETKHLLIGEVARYFMVTRARALCKSSQPALLALSSMKSPPARKLVRIQRRFMRLGRKSDRFSISNTGALTETSGIFRGWNIVP